MKREGVGMRLKQVYKEKGEGWETGLQKTYLPRNDVVLTMVFFQAYGKREALAIVARSEL